MPVWIAQELYVQWRTQKRVRGYFFIRWVDARLCFKSQKWAGGTVKSRNMNNFVLFVFHAARGSFWREAAFVCRNAIGLGWKRELFSHVYFSFFLQSIRTFMLLLYITSLQDSNSLSETLRGSFQGKPSAQFCWLHGVCDVSYERSHVGGWMEGGGWNCCCFSFPFSGYPSAPERREIRREGAQK